MVFVPVMFSPPPPQYEVKAPMPSGCFRYVCKQMTKMHEAIYELLPEEQTQVSTRRLSRLATFTSLLTLRLELRLFFYFFFGFFDSLHSQMLFLRVNASYKMHLKRQLARLGVINNGGPQHG